MWMDRLAEISDRRRFALVIWIALALLMALLHLLVHTGGLSYADLPLDDAGTWGVARRPLWVVFTLPTEFHSQPPLYYLLLHFLLKVSSAPWFLRGISWLAVLALLQFILFFAHELTLVARALMCVLIINSNITHYLSTAVRPYGLAALCTVAASFMLMRLVRAPSRRAAWHYGLWASAMLYCMAFDVAVFLAHGAFALIALMWSLRSLDIRATFHRMRFLFVAFAAVSVAYLPYVAMALHYQYHDNTAKTFRTVTRLATYSNTLNQHFLFSPTMTLALILLCLAGVVGSLCQKDWRVLLWPLIAWSSIAFVHYFMVGRNSIGVQPKYMMPAFLAVCYLAAGGLHHVVSPSAKAVWVTLPILLLALMVPAYETFAQTVKSPEPLQQFDLLRREMANYPGKRVIFFDIGYDGQHVEYVARDDADLTLATMPGEGMASGGDSHLDPAYIEKVVADSQSSTRCYFYYFSFPGGPYDTTFLPTMKRLGYKQVAPLSRVYGHPVPGFCKN